MMRTSFLIKVSFCIVITIFEMSCAREEINRHDVAKAPHVEQPQDDHESAPSAPEGSAPNQPQQQLPPAYRAGCTKANSQQWAEVNFGLTKLSYFINYCVTQTGSQEWCNQIARPNPDSHATFACTYSPQQDPHFIHPDETTWANAVQAVRLVQELVAMGVGVDIIYNWWRPEPYNANVGGAAGRHPYGTSVDVRFINKTEQNRAHAQLCKWRSAGRLRALGYYDGTGLHLGIADKTANTWGKSCP